MRLVLVHSPLLGPVSWSAVAKELRDAGVESIIPSLGPSISSAVMWRAHVAAVVETVSREAQRGGLWVVGHSGAGPLLPAVGTELAGRVKRYVFVDAALPHPGRSRFDALPDRFVEHVRSLEVDGLLPPWTEWFGPDEIARIIDEPGLRAQFEVEVPRVPLRMFEETMPVVPSWPDAPCSFLRLSEPYENELRQAEEMGWATSNLEGHHLWLLSRPGQVAAAILALANPPKP